MSENENPSDICPFSKTEEDYSRSWRPWELDFLIDLRGDIPPESWLKVFSQLMRWWNYSYHGHLSSQKKENNFRDMDKVALECHRSIPQLASVWLGTIGVQQVGAVLRDMEELGVFTSKRAGIGQPTSRIMNRPLIEGHYKRWMTDKSVRHFELKKNGELYYRAPGASQFTLWQSREIPCGKNQPMGLEKPTSRDGKNQPMGLEKPTSRDGKNQPLLVDGFVDGIQEFDGTRTDGDTIDGAARPEKTSELDFNLLHYLTDSLNDLISDDDFKYVKSSTIPERQTVIRIIQEISKQELLPCRLPTDASQTPTKQLLKTVARLLSILKDTWDLPVCQPIWRPGSESPIASFRTTILNAAKHYSQRMANQAERPRNLHDWVYLEHRDPSSASSGLLYEISLMQKEQERLGSTNEKVRLLQRLTAAEIRLLEERLKPVPGGEKLPHPTAFWRRMLDWQEFMERHEKDLRFHAAIHAGWFRVQTRNCSCAMLLQLYDRYRYSQEKEPTAWVPLIDEAEWDEFASWLRAQEGTELFVDLNFRSPLSVQEQEQALQVQEVERVTKTVKAHNQDEWSKKAVQEWIRPSVPEISDALASYGDLLLRLRRSALVQRSVNRLHAAKTLLWWIQHPPKELWPDEEAPVALFAQGLLVQIRDEWYEHEAKLFELGSTAGLFRGLPTETQD